MIIAIAANKNNLKAQIDPQFGRCKWFCLFDSESGECSFMENPTRNNEEKAGRNAAELLIGKNISMVIAGRFGSKVMDVFRKNNVQMVIPENQNSITEIINQFK